MKREMDYNVEAYDWCVPLSELVGKTIVKLEQVNDWRELRFFCSDGTVYALHHFQDCCENVYLEDVNGELSWLLDTPVLMADEAQGETGMEEEYGTEYRWTFYRFATRKGYVDLRFLGLSNGYYSERMDFIRIPEELVTQWGWIQAQQPQCAKTGGEEEDQVVCLFCRQENRLKILVPRWAREYGFWLEYGIDGEDIVGEEGAGWEKVYPMLKEWLEKAFFPVESRELIRDAERREAFLTRIKGCGCKIACVDEEDWEKL